MEGVISKPHITNKIKDGHGNKRGNENELHKFFGKQNQYTVHVCAQHFADTNFFGAKPA